jgi:hypothetical protein
MKINKIFKPDLPTLIEMGLYSAYLAKLAILLAKLAENKRVYLYLGRKERIVLIASSKAYSNNLSASSNTKYLIL